MSELLKVSEVARRLGLSTRTIRNYMDAGKLPYVRLGGKTIMVRESALENFIKEGGKKGD